LQIHNAVQQATKKSPQSRKVLEVLEERETKNYQLRFLFLKKVIKKLFNTPKLNYLFSLRC